MSDTLTITSRNAVLSKPPVSLQPSGKSDVPFVQTQIAQGDVLFRLVEALPNGCSLLSPVDGCYTIMPPSEGRPSGSHTINASSAVVAYSLTGSALPGYIVVETAARVDHDAKQGESHFHPSVSLTRGIWQVIRQREYDNKSAGKGVASYRAAAD